MKIPQNRKNGQDRLASKRAAKCEQLRHTESLIRF